MIEAELEKASSLSEPVYLQKGVSLTDDEKVTFYDELKEKYCQIIKKFENYERKCSYITKQVNNLEKVKCKTKNKKKIYKKKFSGQNTTSGQFEAIENDDTIPHGWKSSWRTMDGFSKGQKIKVYWAPNGKCCSSRVSALNYMLTELQSSEEDIELMKKSLLDEGWTGHDSLPAGWLHFDDPKKCSKKFVTSDFHYLKNIKVAVKHLSLHFSEAELGQFLVTFALKKTETSFSDIEWLHDEAIPYPWKAAHIKNGKGSSNVVIVISSDGQVLCSLKIVHEFIEKAGEMSKDELKRFIEFLSKEKNQGKLIKIMDDSVKADATLVERSIKVEKDVEVKSFRPEGAIVKVEKDSEISATPKPSRRSKGSSVVWNDDDCTLPKGWKSAVSEDGQYTFGQKFKDPQGRLYHGRLDALRNMVKNSEMYSVEDVTIVKEGLVNDGWLFRDSLPEGWMLKKVKMSSEKLFQRSVYLTPTFEILETFEKVFSYMKENKYSEEEIARFKANNGLNWKSDEDLPPGWTYAVVTTERQGKLKRYMDPQGKFWNSSSQVVKKCFIADPHGEDVKQVRNYLIRKDGWFESEYLPEGWIMRQKRSEKGFCFMNTVYEKFNTTKAMYKHLRENNYGEQAVQKFDYNYKKLQVPIADEKEVELYATAHDISEEDISMSNDDDSVEMDSNENEEDVVGGLDWRSDRSLPNGWMMTETEIYEGKLAGTIFRRYMSPCRNYFGNLPEALKFLGNDDNLSNEDFELMKKGLRPDGWGEANYLPVDWLSKQVKGKEENFLSPSFNIFTKSNEVLDYLRDNDYTEREIERFRGKDEKLKWKQDESVPNGWKVGVVGDGKKFLSPAGNVFNNRPLVIKHMLDSDKYSNDDITQMQLGLADDGWIYDENLPPGWLKKRWGNTWNFLTSKYEMLNSIAEVLKHLLLTRSSPEIVDKFKNTLGETAHANVLPSPITSPSKKPKKKQSDVLSLLSGITVTKTQDSKLEPSKSTQSSELSPNVSKLEWNTDESLPEGWKQAGQNVKSSEFTRFMSPSQKYFGSRIQAIQHMVSCGLFKLEEISKMKKSFEKDGFSFSDNLPAGWMSKGTLYLTHTHEKLFTNESVIKFMKENGYNSDEIERFFENSSASWNYNDSLPKGWKLSEISTGFDPSKKWFKYMSPDGKVMSSRAQAIRYMTSLDNFTEEDIEKMKSGIQDDGWITGPNLPPGWYQKKRDQTHVIYLTPNFETLKSLKNAISYMKMKNYDPEVIKNFKPNGYSSVSVQVTPVKRKLEEGDVSSTPKLKSPRISGSQTSNDDAFRAPKPFSFNQKDKNLQDWEIGDQSLPGGWKKRNNLESKSVLYLSTHGHVYSTRAEAFKYMMDHPETYSKSDIEEVESKLVHEEWHSHSLLPVGWRMKKLQGDVLTLSDSGSMYRVVKSARAKIKKTLSEKDLKNFSSLMDSLKPNNRENLSISTKPLSIKPEPKDVEQGLLKSNSREYLDMATKPSDAEEELKDPLDVSNIEPSQTVESSMSSSMNVIKIKKERTEDAEESINAVKSPVIVKKEPLPVSLNGELEDEIMPPGWKIETDENSEEVILNPDGKRFASRRDAVEFMIKNNYTPKSIYNLWNSLDQEGWILQSDLIPPGWRVKYQPGLFDYKYLTREMKIIHSTEEASLMIKQSEDYDKDKFDDWASEVKKSSPKIVWKTDASLPSNWLLSCGLQNEIIKDPRGSLFEGRKEAIDHMIKEHCSPTDIFKLWNTLHIEGWISDEENLPTGWKRKYFADKNRHQYLSPMMEVVKSSISLLNIVKTGKEYTEEEMRKVKNWRLKEGRMRQEN